MKRWIALALALICMLILIGCGKPDNKEKLVGTWSHYSSSSVGESSSNYFFDKEGNAVYVYMGDVKTNFLGYTRVSCSMTIKIGKYSMREKEIIIEYSHLKDYYFSFAESVEEKDIEETETIPYYISEYSDRLVFKTNDVGESDYKHYEETNQTYEEYVSFYEEYWPTFLKLRIIT